MNKGNVADTEMENIMDTTVDGLFSVFATLGKSANKILRTFISLELNFTKFLSIFRRCSRYSQPKR